MRYGVFDTDSQMWIGQANEGAGPLSFGEGDDVNGVIMSDEEAKVFARLAMEAATHCTDSRMGRFEVRPFPLAEDWHQRDEIPLTESPWRWLRMKERGTIP